MTAATESGAEGSKEIAGARAQVPDPERAGAICGFLSTAAGFAGVILALSVSPWFVWTKDALSDLGHPKQSSAAIFNAGLILAGILYLAFVAGLARALPRGLIPYLGLAFLAAGAISLSSIGIFTEAAGPIHFVVSLTYFSFVPLGMVTLAATLRRSQRAFAIVTVATAAAAALVGLSILAAIAWRTPFPSQAIPEFIASVLLGAWAVVAAWMLLSGRLSLRKPEADGRAHLQPVS